MMKEILSFIVIPPVVVILVVWGLFSLGKKHDNNACHKQYGAQYHAAGGGYSPVICVSPDGTGRYLK